MHWGSCTGQYMERFMSVGKFAHEHGIPPVARMRPGAVHVPAYQDPPISSSSVHAASPSTVVSLNDLHHPNHVDVTEWYVYVVRSNPTPPFRPLFRPFALWRIYDEQPCRTRVTRRRYLRLAV